MAMTAILHACPRSLARSIRKGPPDGSLRASNARPRR